MSSGRNQAAGFSSSAQPPGHPQSLLLPRRGTGVWSSDCTFAERRSLSEDYRLHSGNIKPLPAPRVLALHEIIAAKHIGLRVGKFRAVTFVGVAAQYLLLGTHQPPDLVAVRVPAVQAREVRWLPSFRLVEEIPFIHDALILAVIDPECHSGVGRKPIIKWEESTP